MRTLLLLLAISGLSHAQLRTDGAAAAFKGSLPPKPTADLNADQIQSIEKRLALLARDFSKVSSHPRAADADIFLKAVRYAIDFHEWYDKKPEDGMKKAAALLDEAALRIEALMKNQTPWMEGSGPKVFGFYSSIDDSPQPYGVEIPDGLRFVDGQPKFPMWIWLHGRGDTNTDLHFIYGRLNLKKAGQFQPRGTIVIHPFGRYCNGWKSAGETDVFEARDDALSRFPIDPNRIALAGFSMGGAGAWHIGAHFADQWACVHAGAGFVDVKRYQKLTADKMPPWYEQKLWGVYDVPNYARNFFNVPLICYSGEIDPQRDAAEYMMETLAQEGLHPPHLIGPGMGHKYHPEVIKDVQSKIEAAVAQGREILPKKIVLQTRTLAYSRMHWLQIIGLQHPWEDARAEAIWDEPSNRIRVTTKNVSGLAIHLAKVPNVSIDGLEVRTQDSGNSQGPWIWHQPGDHAGGGLVKRPRLQGPIDDGFKSRFIVVLPEAQTNASAVDRWVSAEASHFLVRWRSLMRGDAIVKNANELTDQDFEKCHLVLWGTPNSNSLVDKIFGTEEFADTSIWNEQLVKIGGHEASSDRHVPVFCYPNPLNPDRYVIVNSGLTFREAHDRTNSLQNPKLPDWAILDVSVPADSEQAGNVVAADFFDNRWKVRPRTKSPLDRE